MHTETDRDQGGDVLSTSEAAKVLGVTIATMRKYEIPWFPTPGGHRRYLRRDLDRFRTAAP